jgi:hypothetical protein
MEKNTEGTVTLEEQKTGEEGKPPDLDQLIDVAVGGEEESPETQALEPGTEEAKGEKQEPEATEDQNDLSQEQGEADQEEPQESDGNPEWFNRRIGKEVRKRKELEESISDRDQELTSVRQELETLRAQGKQSQTGDNPLSQVDSVEKLTEERNVNLQRLDFADSVEELLDDGDIDGAIKRLESQDVKFEADPEGYEYQEEVAKEARKLVKKVRTHSRKSLDQWIPERAQFLSFKNEAGVVARKEYPWLNDKTSEEMMVFNEAVKNVPLFKQFPDYELQVARYVTGALAEMKKGQGQPAKKAAPRKVPPTSSEPKPVAAPAISDDEQSANYRSSRDRVYEKGDGDSLDNYLGNLLGN